MKRILSMVLVFVMVFLAAWPPAALAATTGTYEGFWYYDDGTQIAIRGYNGDQIEISIPAQIGGKPVTSIEPNAFQYRDALTSVTIPDSVSFIGDFAFNKCSGLTTVSLGNGVTHIGAEAFSGCTGLTYVTIPSGVTTILVGAFIGCSRLEAIHVDSENPAYSSVDGVLFNKGKTALIAYILPGKAERMPFLPV